MRWILTEPYDSSSDIMEYHSRGICLTFSRANFLVTTEFVRPRVHVILLRITWVNGICRSESERSWANFEWYVGAYYYLVMVFACRPHTHPVEPRHIFAYAKRIAFECDHHSRQHQTQTKKNRHLLDIELNETKLIDGILWHKVTPLIRCKYYSRITQLCAWQMSWRGIAYGIGHREQKKKRDKIISAENCVPTGSGANSRIINGMRVFLEHGIQRECRTKPSQAKPADRITIYRFHIHLLLVII